MWSLMVGWCVVMTFLRTLCGLKADRASSIYDFSMCSDLPPKPDMPPVYPRPDITAGAGFEDLQRHDALRDQAEQVAGYHFTEWVPVLDRLRAEKQDDEALALLMEIIAATERGARFSGREPAPGCTHRAAVILRRRKDYQAEIDLIERWERACPPERRGPGATQGKLAERKRKARELLSRI